MDELRATLAAARLTAVETAAFLKESEFTSVDQFLYIDFALVEEELRAIGVKRLRANAAVAYLEHNHGRRRNDLGWSCLRCGTWITEGRTQADAACNITSGDAAGDASGEEGEGLDAQEYADLIALMCADEPPADLLRPDDFVPLAPPIDFDILPPSVSANFASVPLPLRRADALEAAPAAEAAAAAVEDVIAAAGPPRIVLRFACSGWALVHRDGATHYVCEVSGESMFVLPFVALTEYAVFVFLASALEERGAVDEASSIHLCGVQGHLFNPETDMAPSAAMLVELKLVHNSLVAFVLSANARECFGLTLTEGENANSTVFIRLIPPEVEADDLRALFEKHAGPIKTVKTTKKGYA